MFRLNAMRLSLALFVALLSVSGFVQAETIHEERSKYRDITVTQVGDRRCLLFNVHRGDRTKPVCWSTTNSAWYSITRA